MRNTSHLRRVPTRAPQLPAVRGHRRRLQLRFLASFSSRAVLCTLIMIGLPRLAHSQPQVLWNFAGPDSAPGRVVALAADPHNDSVVYLAAPAGGIWRTPDGGVTWLPLRDSASSLQFCSLAIDRRIPGRIYAGTGDLQSPRPAQGVVHSRDGGRTWTDHRFTSQPVCTVEIDPSNSDRIFAGSSEGLFLSSDSGASWNKVLDSPVTSVAFDGPGEVYAGMIGNDAPGARENILAHSLDGGLTWNNLTVPPSPLPRVQTNWVSITASAGTLTLVVSYEPAGSFASTAAAAQTLLSDLDSYRSTDGGITWTASFAIGQARPPVRVLADSVAGTLYLAGGALLFTENQGVSWSAISTATREFHTAAITGGVLLLGGETGLEAVGLVPEAGTGISQLPLGQFFSARIDSGNNVWGAGASGLYRLSPFTTRQQVRLAGIGPVGNVATASGSSNIFASGNGLVYVSTDGGARFSARTVIAAGEMRAAFPPFQLDPVTSSTAYVAGRRVYRTTDSGNTWTALPVVDPDPTRVVIALAIAPASPSTLFAATACLPEVAQISCAGTSTIWRSADAGTSWTANSSVSGLVSRLAVDPRQSGTVYAAIGAFPGGPSMSAGRLRGNLLRSTDNGATWTSIRGNLPDVPVNAVIIDPNSLPAQTTQPAQRLYAGTDTGVFVSFNAGLQWTDITGSVIRSLPQSPVTDLSLQSSDGTLLAATFGRGIFSASTSGLSPGLVVNPLSVNVTLMEGMSQTSGISLANTSTAATMGWALSALDSWASVPITNGVLPPNSTVDVPVRVSAASLKAGEYRGQLQAVSGSFVQNIAIRLHVTPAPAQVRFAADNPTVGAAGSALPPLRVLVLDANNDPMPGIAVRFSIAAGGGSLNPVTSVSNSAGVAATVMTLPSVPGEVRIVAAVGEISDSLTIKAVAAPLLLSDSVVDGVTFNPYTSLGPGSILSISGRNLAVTAAVAGEDSLPASLENTRVLLSTPAETVALPLFSVSPQQIRALVPAGTPPGPYNIHVEVGAGRSNEVRISIAAFAPGILTRNGSGRGPGLFMKNDGSLITTANPADRGTIIEFHASGLGPVDPPIGAGQAGAAPPGNRTIATPRVFFDGYQAQVIYSGLAPGIAGRYLVRVQVPLLLSPATNVSVSLTAGGFSGNRVTIPVR